MRPKPTKIRDQRCDCKLNFCWREEAHRRVTSKMEKYRGGSSFWNGTNLPANRQQATSVPPKRTCRLARTAGPLNTTKDLLGIPVFPSIGTK